MTKRAAEEAPPSFGSSDIGPEFFSYYRDQVVELLSEEGRIPHHELGATKKSSTEIIRAEFPSLKTKKLNALLRQCVWDLTPEVDEMHLRVRSMTEMRNIKPEDPTFKEVEEEIQKLMKFDPGLVKDIMRKQSNDLLATLDYMQQQLEKILDNVATTCRTMGRGEKRDLQKSIKELPGQNLKRIAGIIKDHYVALGKEFTDEVKVNLEEENNIVLWRLHFYVCAVKNARKLAS